MNVETINDLKQNAWLHSKAAMSAIEDSAKKKIRPDMPPTEAIEVYAQEIAPYLIDHMTRTEVACAMAVKHGIIPAEVIGALMGATRSFCQAAISGKRAFCKRSADLVDPCDWRGEVAECGPVGVCPRCGTAPVQTLDLAAPNLPNAHTNGRFKLVDP